VNQDALALGLLRIVREIEFRTFSSIPYSEISSAHGDSGHVD
jgi:hypothetical protein